MRGSYLLPADAETRDLSVEEGGVATLREGIIGKAEENVAPAN